MDYKMHGDRPSHIVYKLSKNTAISDLTTAKQGVVYLNELGLSSPLESRILDLVIVY